MQSTAFAQNPALHPVRGNRKHCEKNTSCSLFATSTTALYPAGGDGAVVGTYPSPGSTTSCGSAGMLQHQHPRRIHTNLYLESMTHLGVRDPPGRGADTEATKHSIVIDSVAGPALSVIGADLVNRNDNLPIPSTAPWCSGPKNSPLLSLRTPSYGSAGSDSERSSSCNTPGNFNSRQGSPKLKRALHSSPSGSPILSRKRSRWSSTPRKLPFTEQDLAAAFRKHEAETALSALSF